MLHHGISPRFNFAVRVCLSISSWLTCNLQSTAVFWEHLEMAIDSCTQAGGMVHWDLGKEANKQNIPTSEVRRRSNLVVPDIITVILEDES